MADDPTIIDPAQAQASANAVKDYGTAVDNAGKSTEQLSNQTTKLSSYLDGLQDDLSKGVTQKLNDLNKALDQVGVNLQKTSKLTEDQQGVFGVMSTALLGAGDSYKKLSVEGLNSFSDQIKRVGADIDKSPIFDLGKKIASQKGILGDNAIIDFAKRFTVSYAESADNALHLQGALLQLSAAQGTLGQVYRSSSSDYENAGANLDHINAITEQQNQIIQQTARSTGLAASQISEYYTQLGGIQGAVTANVQGSRSLGDNVNGLTAAFLLAKGSGRDFKDIVNDMSDAFENYNITGQPALEFTSRMTEISEKFNIPIKDVNDSLLEVSKTFGIFGNQAEGAARLYNNYLGALKNTGISGPQAVRIVQSMTENIAQLGIAQKAFLSAQTGGPGGLLGGFQIEKELREGKIDQVFERVRQTLSKQFGKIVTLEEGAQSQAAAQQLEKQVLLLTQGPLGQLVKSPEQAYRVLEAFRAREQGGPVKELGKDFLQGTMETGNEIQKQTNTILTPMAQDIEQIRDQTSFLSLDTLQNLFTASSGAGRTGPDLAATQALRGSLSETIRGANEAGAEAARNAALTLGTGKLTTERDTRGTDTARALENIKDIPKQLSLTASSFYQNIKSTLVGKNERDADRLQKEYTEQLNRAKNLSISSGRSPEEIETSLKNISEKENLVKEAFSNYKPSAPATGDLSTPSPTFRVREVTRPSANLGLQAAAVANRTAATPTTADLGKASSRAHAAHEPVKVGDITVHVEGYCLNCKSKMEKNTQTVSTNTTLNLP